MSTPIFHREKNILKQVRGDKKNIRGKISIVNLIFDLDSTLISVESSELALEKNLQKLPENSTLSSRKKIRRIFYPGSAQQISIAKKIRPRIIFLRKISGATKKILPRKI